MFEKLSLFIICIGLIHSLDQSDAKQEEACMHLYKAAKIVGCHETPKMPVNTNTIFLCDQFYLTNENDTCELISQNLNISLSLIIKVVDCDNVEANRLVCIKSNVGANETYEKFIEPFAESNLDFLDSSETSDASLEALISESNKNKSVGIEELEIEEGLRQHNFYRKLHKVDQLVYNETIAAKAQKWAEYLASKNKLAHNYESPYGENIAQACGYPGFSVSIAASKWYEEIKNFNFTTGMRISKELDIGHFTQLVWKNTQIVGFGKAIDDQNCVYVVANYFPPGNIRGRYMMNVLDLE